MFALTGSKKSSYVHSSGAVFISIPTPDEQKTIMAKLDELSAETKRLEAF